MKVTPDIKLFYILTSYHMKDSYIFVTCTVICEEELLNWLLVNFKLTGYQEVTDKLLTSY